MTAFYGSDYRLRQRIRRLLEQQQIDCPDPHTAFQLVLCNCIGFGGPREEKSIATGLQYSGRTQNELEDELAKMKSFYKSHIDIPGKTYENLSALDHIATDVAVHHYHGKTGLQQFCKTVSWLAFSLCVREIGVVLSRFLAKPVMMYINMSQ